MAFKLRAMRLRELALFSKVIITVFRVWMKGYNCVVSTDVFRFIYKAQKLYNWLDMEIIILNSDIF